MERMKATVFHGKNDIPVDEVEKPRAGVGEAIIRVTLTTICGTDLHIVRGEYPVKSGLIIGHEPVGVIEEIGKGLPDIRSVIGSWSARLLHAVNAARACRDTPHNAVMARATKHSEAGVSVTQSMARRPSICECPMRRPTSQRFLMS